MEDLLFYNTLYDTYGSLLTDKQRSYFEDYYFNNLSYSEMAENYEVSRNAIFKQLHITIDKLKEYEDKLGIVEKNKKLSDIINVVEDKSLKSKLEEIIG